MPPPVNPSFKVIKNLTAEWDERVIGGRNKEEELTLLQQVLCANSVKEDDRLEEKAIQDTDALRPFIRRGKGSMATLTGADNEKYIV
mmetsp:Transcript_19778/g.26858  ORF Transcript_19778/g.26858 Transcript_19778/m.26858 type:complete len:87 (+) Transcript_19778:95-355(+)